MDVHTPYYPHKGTVSEGINKREAVKLFHRVDGQRNQASEHDLELLRRLYRGELEYLDDRLGDLFDRLEDHIDIDESIVAFGSDHGEAFNEHGHVFHPDGVLYDELVHIPLLVSGPEFESANVDTPVSNVDIVPTLLAAADITVPNDCVGRDLADVAAELPDRYAFSEGWTEDDGRAMVSSEEYKLVLDLEEGWTRLFNRVDDPVEQTDISAENPTVRNQLRAVLDDHVKMTRNHTGERRDVNVDDDVKDRLRRLGYAE
jgi:arylsulfatase A-like enzyme